MTDQLTRQLENLIGEESVSKFDPVNVIYPTKHAFDVRQRNVINVKPGNGREIHSVLNACKDARVPVTPIGSLTSNRGQAFPVYGGVTLDCANMKGVKDLDMDGLTVTVLPGTTYEELNANIIKRGYRMRVTPLRNAAATVAGFIAEGGLGIGSLKYGPASSDLLHMNFANPYISFIPIYYGLSVYPENIPYLNSELDPFVSSGGGKVTSYALGYNLKEFFTGSEGSIGLMTQATFAVRPGKTLPSARLFEFENLSDAIGSLTKLSFHQNTPYHVALLDSPTLALFGIEVPGTKHFLLVALDDEDPEKRTNFEKSHDTALTNLSKTLDSAHAEQTWKSMQTGLGLAKSQNLILTEEVRIPMSVLSHALELVTKIGQKSSVDLALCAHAMSSQDCLLTALFKLHDKNDLETMKRFEITAAEIRETLVGEQGLPYGMGLVNLGILDWKFPFQASLMRTLKKRLDPLGILNPGKIFGNPPSGG